MRRINLTLGLAVLATSCGATGSGPAASPVETGPAPLTVEQILARPGLTGTAPTSVVWSPDSARLAFLWCEPGESRREVWVLEADGTGLRQFTQAEAAPAGVREFAWMPHGKGVLHLRSGLLERTRLNGSMDRSSAVGSDASNLQVSPDGKYASYLSGGDLWFLELSSGSTSRVTSAAVPTISSLTAGRYARRDVEVGPYVWGGPTYAWSPDSRTIAVHYVDRRHLPVVPFPDYLAAETAANPVRRGYPGDPNEARTVGLLRIDSGELTLLDLPDPTENRIVDFSWSPRGALLIDRESDTAVDRWLDVVDPATGVRRELWHDHRESRVYTSSGSAWHVDGERVVVLADLADRYGLYLVGGDLVAPLPLTNPAFDVTAPPQVVGGGGAIVFQANEPSPHERHVFRLSPGGGRPERLSVRPGEHRAYPSPDGQVVALLHSDDRTPTELYLKRVGDAGPARRMTRSTPDEFEEREWARVRYVTLPSQVDGRALHARVLEPPTLAPGKRYPVLFGPMYSNTVRNRWGGRYGLIQQLLVQRGYIVIQVDVRGSTGYGRDFREAFLMDFAGKDLEDVESAVRHVATWSHVDPERFGVWGSSYGGTLTIYALLKKPGLFRAGVAAAAAVDPHFFGGDDVAIVRRPQTNPEAFARGAAQYAGNLEDALLIIHGMQDQVVPFKTTVVLADELMRQGKDFDFAFAPHATHGWTSPTYSGRYLLNKLVQHFDRHLAVPE